MKKWYISINRVKIRNMDCIQSGMRDGMVTKEGRNETSICRYIFFSGDETL